MLRIILGVIAGFITWSLVWVGTDLVLGAIFPDSYAKYIIDLQQAAAANQPFETKTSMNIFAILLSIVCSVISGFVAATIAKENTISTLILGVLLLAVGLFVEISYWTYFPLWHHLTFLILLIPVTILGGKLRKV
jgi:hypothetical protein